MVFNALLAVSNVVGVIPAWIAYRHSGVAAGLLILTTAVASMFMHMCEVKHGLPGLVWQQHHQKLLWWDRVMALASGGYGLWCWLQRGRPSQVWWVAVPGLVCLAVSEHLCDPRRGSSPTAERVETGRFLFAMFHFAWHGLAYASLALVV